MKTAISINDGTFARAESAAAALGISRSEFFSRGAALYLAQLDEQQIATRIDEVLDRIGNESPSRLGLARLEQLTEDDEW